MRDIFPHNEFKRDLRRAARGRNCRVLVKGGEFDSVKDMLANDIPLPPKYKDHPLHHNWEGSRECHIKPDFILVYTFEGEDLLIFERLGTHAEIFGL